MLDNSCKVKILKKGRYLQFLEKGKWEFIKRCDCTGVVIIIAMTKKKEIILTEQYRVPVGKNVIEFPAGLVNDKGRKKETRITAAKRELIEETGYKARRLVKIMEGPSSSGTSAEVITIYRAEGISKVGDGGGDHLEDITVHVIPIKKINKWLIQKQRKGCLTDPKIYAGLYFLNHYNK